MSQSESPARMRYRIRFGKEGVMRYTSHLDVARTWERALRRAGVPLIYSQGFNPRPQIQLAAALPLGCESRAEVLDIFLEDEIIPSPADLLPRIAQTLPEGLVAYEISEVNYHEPALQTLRSAASYEVFPGETLVLDELQKRVTHVLAQESLPRRRRKKVYDLRPLIIDLKVLSGEPVQIWMRLVSSQEDGTGRPDEVLEALGLDPLDARIVRTNLTFDLDGESWRSVEIGSE